MAKELTIIARTWEIGFGLEVFASKSGLV